MPAGPAESEDDMQDWQGMGLVLGAGGLAVLCGKLILSWAEKMSMRVNSLETTHDTDDVALSKLRVERDEAVRGERDANARAAQSQLQLRACSIQVEALTKRVQELEAALSAATHQLSLFLRQLPPNGG